ncbi:hypothetical protein D9M71_698580 [compost metagenome]
MRLDVGVIGAEQLFGAVDGQLLDHVDMLATAVVTLARITFGILVGQAAALGLHHTFAGVVLRGDQFDVIFLTLLLGSHRRQQCIVVTLDLIVFAEHMHSSRRRPSVAVFFVGPIVQKRQLAHLSDIDIEMPGRPAKGQSSAPRKV